MFCYNNRVKLPKLTTSDKIQQGLDKLGIERYEDVLLHLPRTYTDFSPTPETNLHHKDKIVFTCKIVSKPVFTQTYHTNIISFSVVTFEKHYFKVIAFNRSYLLRMLKEGDTYTMVGTFDETRNAISLVHLIKGILEEGNTLRPIYTLPNEIENFMFVRLVKKAFAEINPQTLLTDVPLPLQSKYRLISKLQALRKIHFPTIKDDVYAGLRVLKYEEAFQFSLLMKKNRIINQSFIKSFKTAIDETRFNQKIQALPYALTDDQQRAIQEIVSDMKRPQVMMRLLQGDVGSGKTLVAALALYANHTRHQQGALMVPTEALARQHYRTLQSLFASTGLQINLLLGSFNASQKAQVKERLSEGGVDILIGTHALFSEDVKFLNLGLVIIDEQHRFGVNQRDALKGKGEDADLLLMSATPIPRTLALSVYGDLDVSTLMQFPFANRQVTTRLHHPEDVEVTQAIQDALNQKKRVYIIAPMINESTQGTYAVEPLYEEFAKAYPHQVGLLHGKLSTEEKEETLLQFSNGQKPILVSTTVIEVGIDVKEATLMIIYDAHHFGLASLHQLRGRIGRDGSHALCILLTEDFDEEIVQRLNVLVQSNDGFFIAEEDLKRRGPGELLGSKQSGLPHFAYINLVTDLKILQAAKQDVEALKIEG